MARERPKRINLKYGLSVDHGGKGHNPIVSYTDGRLKFNQNSNFSIAWRVMPQLLETRHQILFSLPQASGHGIMMGYMTSTKQAFAQIATNAESILAGNNLNINSDNFLVMVYSGYTKEMRLYCNDTFIEARTQTSSFEVGIREMVLGYLNTEAVEPNQYGGLAIHNELIIFNTEIDRKGGAVYLEDIKSMELLGNYVPTRLHPYVAAHYSMQEAGGGFCFDAIEQYNYAAFGGVHNFGRGKYQTYPEFLYNGITEVFTAQGNTGNYEILMPYRRITATPGVLYKMQFEVFTIEYSESSYEGSLNAHCFGANVSSVRSIGVHNILFTVGNSQADAAKDCVFEFESKKFKGTFGNIKVIAEGAENNIKLKAVPLQLLGYTAAEKGITNGISPVRQDILTKQTAEIFQTSGGNAILTNGLRTEIETGLPEIKNALKVTGKTIPYPAGTIILGLPEYNAIAYKVKVGETLTTRQELELSANGLFSNPTPDISMKLESFWQHNDVYNNAGTPSLKDLIGTNHIPLTVFTGDELTLGHGSYAFKSLETLRTQ